MLPNWKSAGNLNFEYHKNLSLRIKYKYYFDSSKSCWNALSMYKGRSVLIIIKIGDYCFLFAFPKVSSINLLLTFLVQQILH